VVAVAIAAVEAGGRAPPAAVAVTPVVAAVAIPPVVVADTAEADIDNSV
jgi:hypothetical protein